MKSLMIKNYSTILTAGVKIWIKQIEINGKIEKDMNKFPEDLKLRAEEIEFITETESIALSEILIALRLLNTNVAMLSAHIKHLEWIIPIVFTIGVIIIGTLVTIK